MLHMKAVKVGFTPKQQNILVLSFLQSIQIHIPFFPAHFPLLLFSHALCSSLDQSEIPLVTLTSIRYP